MNVLRPYADQTYALFRIVTGFLFFWHGSQKLLGFPASNFDPPWHIQYIAGGIELVGGAMIMLGLFTAPVAFVSAGLMAVAYWMAHFSVENWLPIMNRGDAAVLYCFAFLYMSTKGSQAPTASTRRGRKASSDFAELR